MPDAEAIATASLTAMLAGAEDGHSPSIFDDHRAIADVVGLYLQAATTGEPGALRSVFADYARIVGQIDGQLMELDPDAFVAWVSDNDASPTLDARIVSCDLSGTVARIRIEIDDWLGFRFTDFFLLSKEFGTWRFTSKVFDAHARNHTPHEPPSTVGPLTEAEAIAAVVDQYLDSARIGSARRMREIWFDHARIVGTLDGNPVNRTADAFSDRIGQSGGAPHVRGRAVSIDQSGLAASTRIEIENWDGIRYTDMFTMFKAAGRWRVAGKVFDAHGGR